MTLFFVHIPKTGGTSFRKAAEEFYPKNEIIYDYNPRSKETSAIIKSLSYKENDLFRLSQRIVEDNVKFVAGHVNAAKYSSVFGICNTITFVRDPAQQLISHYRHFKRDYGYQGDFESFTNETKFSEIQSRMLSCVPLEAYGFVGITEEYDSSVELFNSTFGARFSIKYENVTDAKPEETNEITEEMIRLARTATKKDRSLYKKAVRMHNTRKYLSANSLPFTYGSVDRFDGKTAIGFAFQKSSNDAILIHLEINDKIVSVPKLATTFRSFLAAYNAPRGGFVGFEISMTKLSYGDKITCLVSETGQVLWESYYEKNNIGSST